MQKVKTIQDIVINNRFLNYDEFVQKFENIRLNFLEYQSLVAAIPKEWIRLLKIESMPHQSMENKLQKTTKISKTIYDDCSIKLTRLDTKYRHRWEELLNLEVSDKVWDNITTTTNKLTNSTKLRAFQYRLQNFALVVNIHLHKWKLQENDLCSFCKEQQETYLHLFVKCKYVQSKIWKPLRNWLYYFCNTQFDINPEEIIFNRFKESNAGMVNTIILITKQFIYAKRCLGKELTFLELAQSIAQTRKIEEFIARKNNKLKIHVNKWQLYDRI